MHDKLHDDQDDDDPIHPADPSDVLLSRPREPKVADSLAVRGRQRAKSRRGRPSPDFEADVVVVGARVAGAATALLLARAGHDVVLVDRVVQPRDTLSTHCIARGGVVQLHRWGLLDAVIATGAPPVRSVSFVTPDDTTTRTIRDTAGVDHVIAPRRHALDPVIVDAAVAAGARLLDGVTVTGVRFDDAGRAVGVDATSERSPLHIAARHVIGADGLRSKVARSVGAGVIESRPSSAATHYVYVSDLDPLPDSTELAMEYHLGGGGFAGVFPTNNGQSCVWVCAPALWSTLLRGDAARRERGFVELLGCVAPGLAERTGRARITDPVRGMTNLPNQVVDPAGDGWWLVGDAGYYRDPITGHGITDAFVHAELLAESLHGLLAGDLTEDEATVEYECRRELALRPIFDVTSELSQLPELERFVELQKHFSRLIEDEALGLAAIPPRPWTRSPAEV